MNSNKEKYSTVKIVPLVLRVWKRTHNSSKTTASSVISFILCSHPENYFSHLDAKEPCGCGPVFFFRTENARQLSLRFFQGLSVRLRKSYMLRNIIIQAVWLCLHLYLKTVNKNILCGSCGMTRVGR